MKSHITINLTKGIYEIVGMDDAGRWFHEAFGVERTSRHTILSGSRTDFSQLVGELKFLARHGDYPLSWKTSLRLNALRVEEALEPLEESE